MDWQAEIPKWVQYAWDSICGWVIAVPVLVRVSSLRLSERMSRITVLNELENHFLASIKLQMIEDR